MHPCMTKCKLIKLGLNSVKMHFISADFQLGSECMLSVRLNENVINCGRQSRRRHPPFRLAEVWQES